MTSSQQQADSWLAAWQLLRHVPPLVRMALIEALLEIELAQRHAIKSAPHANSPCI